MKTAIIISLLTWPAIIGSTAYAVVWVAKELHAAGVLQ